MKRVKCAIFDTIFIPDISLTIKKNEIVEIPDEFFSADLKKAIQKNHVLCEGMSHKGKLVKFDNTPQLRRIELENTPTNVHTRLNALERSVSMLLQKDYQIPDNKYEDYMLYTNTFITSNYDALVFDTFLDSTKRNPVNPGDALVIHSALTSKNKEDYSFYNSKEFKINGTISEFMPMAKWSGNGMLLINVSIGEHEYNVLDTSNPHINFIGMPIKTNKSDRINISISLKAMNSTIELESYGILIKT